MTLDSTTSKVQYTQSGTTTAWPVPYKFLDNGDLIVITTVDGVDTALVLDTDYTVTGAGDDAGGTVTISPAVASGTRVTIYRVVDLDQPTELTTAGGWFPKVHEAVFDRLTMIDQQLQEQLDRAVKLAPTTTLNPDTVAEELFEARDDAQTAASEAEASAIRAEIASSTVAYYNHEGTLTAGQDTITLPWAYDTSVGVEVFLSGVKQTESSLVFTDAYTVTLDTPVSADTPFEVVASSGARSDLSSTLAGPGGSSLVGFLQDGTGATARTVQAKLRDVVSVKDFGAVGDGVTDDTAAIQAAILAVGNGAVFFPNGVYLISETLEITRNSVSLVGSGRAAATIRISGDITGVHFHPLAASDDTPKSSCGILNLHINHADGNTTSPAILLTQQQGFTMQNVSVGNHQRCLRIEGGNQSNYGFLNFSSSGNTASSVSGGGVVEIDEYLSSQSGTYHPAWTSNFSNFIIGGAKKTNHAIKIKSCDGLHFSNAYIGNTTTTHVYIDEGANTAITSALFSNIYCDGVSGTTTHGVVVPTGTQSSTYLQFNQVHINSVDYGFLLLAEMGSVKITNCSLSDVARTGIYADDTGTSDSELIISDTVMTNVASGDDVNNAGIFLKNIRHAVLNGNIINAIGTNATGLLVAGTINQIAGTGNHYKSCTTDYREIIGTTITSKSLAGNTSTKTSQIGVGVTASGTWTPTGTAGTNVNSLTQYECNYSRNGDIVQVGGQVSVTPESTGAFDFTLSLPVASNFGSSAQASGTAIGTSADPDERASINADTTSDALKFSGTAIGSDAFTLIFTAMYRVL